MSGPDEGGEDTETLGDPQQVKQWPTWDEANDEEILTAFTALARTGMTVVLGGAVKDLIVARGLWPNVVLLLSSNNAQS